MLGGRLRDGPRRCGSGASDAHCHEYPFRRRHTNLHDYAYGITTGHAGADCHRHIYNANSDKHIHAAADSYRHIHAHGRSDGDFEALANADIDASAYRDAAADGAT